MSLRTSITKEEHLGSILALILTSVVTGLCCDHLLWACVGKDIHILADFVVGFILVLTSLPRFVVPIAVISAIISFCGVATPYFK